MSQASQLGVIGLRVQRLEGVPEVMEIGIEGPPLLFGPDLARLFAQVGQQLGIVAGTAELDDIKKIHVPETQKKE